MFKQNKQDKLIKFYKELLEMLDMVVDENGQVFVKGSQLTPLTINKVPVFLPTQENIRTAVDVSNGTIKVSKVLFNPINEDPIKGTSSSLSRLREIIELKMLGVFYQLGESLFYLISDTKRDVTTDVKLVTFAALLGRYKSPGMKSQVDEKTIENWVKLYEVILKEYKQAFIYNKLMIKNGGKVNDVKYNKITILSFPFLEELTNINPNKEKFMGVKIRKKDKHDFLSLYEFVYEESVEKLDEGFMFGSINEIAPAFISLMEAYDFFYKKVKPIITSIIKHDPEEDVIEKLTIKPLPVDIANLSDFVEEVASTVRTIPREDELTKKSTVNKITPPNTTQTITKQPVNQPTQQSNNGGDFWSRMREKFGLDNRPKPVGINGNVYNNPTPVTNTYSRPVGVSNTGMGYGKPVASTGFGGRVNTVSNFGSRVRMPRPVSTGSNPGFVKVGSRTPVTTTRTRTYVPRGFR